MSRSNDSVHRAVSADRFVRVPVASSFCMREISPPTVNVVERNNSNSDHQTIAYAGRNCSRFCKTVCNTSKLATENFNNTISIIVCTASNVSSIVDICAIPRFRCFRNINIKHQDIREFLSSPLWLRDVSGFRRVSLFVFLSDPFLLTIR